MRRKKKGSSEARLLQSLIFILEGEAKEETGKHSHQVEKQLLEQKNSKNYLENYYLVSFNCI
jgi:hypothetical protein